MKGRRFSLEGRLTLLVGANVLLAVVLCAGLLALGLPRWPAVLLALAASLGAAGVSAALFWKPLGATLRAVTDGVRSLQENDLGVRLAVTREDELGELVALYNRMADALRSERNEIYQRELLLDTLLQGAPMAILLLNALDRVAYANTAARRLLAAGGRLSGRSLNDLDVPPGALRDALLAGEDATLAVVSPGGEEETYRLVFRTFHLNTQRHRLVVLEALTQDVRRQELQAWKKVVRVVSHEVNNSLAPVSSLVHSARLAAATPAHAHRLEEILATIEERVHHLSRFLEGYTAFARLPGPNPEEVAWAPFLESVRQAVPFRVLGTPEPPAAYFDPAQMQQVLINLLKNAAEAGSPPESIAVSVEPAPNEGSLLKVLDRGSGMSDAALRSAALPLSSARRSGRGLGLPLCTEILTAHGGRLLARARPGGGTVVTCVLPARPTNVRRAQQAAALRGGVSHPLSGDAPAQARRV